MTICHISDTHTFHESIEVPPVDLLLFSGDWSDQGDPKQTVEFLEWLRVQPAKKIVFIAGNHERYLDKKLCNISHEDSVLDLLVKQKYLDNQSLIEHLPGHIKYLNHKEHIHEGFKIYGFPHTPTFGIGWGFNRNRGEQMQKELAKIPSDVDILLMHGPPYKILDHVPDRYKRYPEEDMNVGCQDILPVIKKRLHKLKLVCFGHIHDQAGIKLEPVSQTRHVLFSNGVVLDNNYKLIYTKPIIINL